MQLHLTDINPSLVRAWEQEFSDFPTVLVHEANILEIAENTIVSPANAYGFMDGGIDRLYTDHFGLRAQEEIQRHIESRDEGYLPVGAAVVVTTGHATVPYMISAPTMMSPEAVPASNCFYAMAAVLNAASRHSEVIESIYCPGLATGTGRVEESLAAAEMAKAYAKWQSSRV